MKLALNPEKWGPSLMGLVFGSAHFWLWRSAFPASGDVISSVTNVSGIAVGFLATAQGLLISLSETQVVRDLKQLGVHSLLMKYFTTAIHSSLLLCLLSLVLSLDPPSPEKPSPFFGQHWMFSLWIGLTVFTLAANYRVISLFSRVLHRASRDK